MHPLKYIAQILLLLSMLSNANSQITSGILRTYHGTTIIAFLKQDHGWIAADTKVAEDNNGTMTGSHHDHKIRKTNGIYYAFTIHPIVHFNDNLIYDAFSLMEATIKEKKDFDTAFMVFDNVINKKLITTINILQENNHLEILEKYTKTSFLGFLMVQYVDGNPIFKVRSYRFEQNNSGYKVVLDPPLVMNGPINIIFLGSYQAATNFLRENKSYFSGFTQMKEKLICLIAKEIAANPNYVGFPVDVVEINSDGDKWHYDIKECPELKQ